MDGDLMRNAVAVNIANLALGHETFEADGATFVRDRRFPNIFDANHVSRITAATPVEIDTLMARVEAEFADVAHRVFHVQPDTPPAFEARLVLEGYIRRETLVMVLEGALRGGRKEFEIRPVVSDADWDAWAALKAADWTESQARESAAERADIGKQMAGADRAKSPPVRYFLAWADGAPRGYFNAWEGVDGVGQVENLFVHPDWRHRGMATALLHHCVADARARGAGPVVICADPTDTPKQMYVALGWVPVAVTREYRRMV